MPIEATGHPHLLKGINRMALVRQLCVQPGLSRADLAMAVGVTKSTVSLLVRELLDEGWLVERDVLITGELGRRPTPLFIDPYRLVLLGAEVGIEGIRVVVTSLTGDVRARATASYGPGQSAEARIAELGAALLRAHRQLDGGGHRVIGIGVGLPGGVDEARGFLHFAPNLGWHKLPVQALLSERLAGSCLAGVPMFLQNEADVAALGELEFNPQQVADPLLYVSLNQGVGAGVVVGDRLLTGHRGFAGEVGHVVLQSNGPPCSCGRRGCAEAFIGLRAILQGVPEPTSAWATIHQRLAQADPDTVRAVNKAGTYLGMLLQNLAAAYDPGCIVLGGAFVDLGESFVEPALCTLNDYASAAGLAPPPVRTSRFGADAVAVGGAALARYRLTRPLAGSSARGAREAA